MDDVTMAHGSLDDLRPPDKRDDTPSVAPGWSQALTPAGTRSRRPGLGLLILGVVVAVAGWIALTWINNQSPDTAGLRGPHRVLKNDVLLHTLSIGASRCCLTTSELALDEAKLLGLTRTSNRTCDLWLRTQRVQGVRGTKWGRAGSASRRVVLGVSCTVGCASSVGRPPPSMASRHGLTRL
jgi:hypothetical protein